MQMYQLELPETVNQFHQLSTLVV